ncbi:MAG: DoxX family protein [Balneolales bacterium]
MKQSEIQKYQDLALLLLRIGVGAIFVYAGWGKITGIEGIQGFFGDLGIPLPGLMAWVVGVIEFFGGLMILAGAYIRIPTPFLAFIMLVAIMTTKLGGDFGAARLDFLLILATVAVFVLGSGKYSVDSFLDSKKPDAAVKESVA